MEKDRILRGGEMSWLVLKRQHGGQMHEIPNSSCPLVVTSGKRGGWTGYRSLGDYLGVSLSDLSKSVGKGSASHLSETRNEKPCISEGTLMRHVGFK